MNRRIIPLNLPARMDARIAGNPATTRLEDVPANCYPGLEVDIRNLDRRFFPGLIFEFATKGDNDAMVVKRGAQLVAVDTEDADLTPKPGEAEAVKKRRTELGEHLNLLKVLLPDAAIFVQSVLLGALGNDGQFCFDGAREITLVDSNGIPFDWDVTWRTVRSIPPVPLRLLLSEVRNGLRSPLMTLQWQRRTFWNEAGEISAAYHAGELTQSLCSPWQHDFRDCSCTYWASSHPDIVLSAHPADIAEVDDPGPDQDRAEDPIIWERHDRERPVLPRGTKEECRPLELDHYEMNVRWRELAFVLEGREQPAPWAAFPTPQAPAFEGDLVERLEILAGVEQALALEYLYARYTVPFYDRLEGELKQHAEFIAHEMLSVAISEMSHLRWVNALIVELRRTSEREPLPALKVSPLLPLGKFTHDVDRAPHYRIAVRRASERPVSEAIGDFVSAEAPSGTVEGQYAQIIGRLKQGRPEDGGLRPDLIGLVQRIVADGVGHYSRFREIQALLQRAGGGRLVKRLVPVAEGSDDYNNARALYKKVIDSLESAYKNSGIKAMKHANEAGEAMKEIDRLAQTLAGQEAPAALPFLKIAYEVAGKLDESRTKAALEKAGDATPLSDPCA